MPKLPYPYVASDWRAVDDTVRGGASRSFLSVNSNGQTALFSGLVDTSVLGNAGFASQSCTFERLDLSRYRGLLLQLPMLREDLVDNDKPRCEIFTFNLKNTQPEERPDGRVESRLTFECHFSRDSRDKSTSLYMPWANFQPFYRGRPQKGEKLDPSKITEISIMCRSNFNKQSGAFSLLLGELSGVQWPSLWQRLIALFQRLRAFLWKI